MFGYDHARDMISGLAREPWLLVVYGDTAPAMHELRSAVSHLDDHALPRTRFVHVTSAGSLAAAVRGGNGRFSDVLYFGEVSAAGDALVPSKGHRVTAHDLVHVLKQWNVGHFEVMTGEWKSLSKDVRAHFP